METRISWDGEKVYLQGQFMNILKSNMAHPKYDIEPVSTVLLAFYSPHLMVPLNM